MRCVDDVFPMIWILVGLVTAKVRLQDVCAGGFIAWMRKEEREKKGRIERAAKQSKHKRKWGRVGTLYVQL